MTATKPARSAAYRAAYARGRTIAYSDAPNVERQLERLVEGADAAGQDDAAEAYCAWLDWIRGDGD